MMMKGHVYRILTGLLVLGGLLLVACEEEINDDEDKAQEKRFFELYMESTFRDTIDPPTESGLYYIEVKQGTGNTPGEEDWMRLNYVCYTIPGDNVVDTYLENVAESSGVYSSAALYGPVKMQNGSRTAGLQEGLMKMREGGQAIMCFTSDLGYGSSGAELMREVPGYTSLKYEVELLEVIEDIEAYEQAKIEAFVDTIEGVDTIHDPYTDAVMYYVIDSMYNGSLIQDDSVVEIAYRGYLTDGRVFDESAEDEPYEFKVGDYSSETTPITGWHIGITRFRGGEKGRLIIPYPLAYGEDGFVNSNIVSIPPYETLVFDIQVVTVNGETEEEKNPDVPE
jgi:FKBP-type peptidyl-prolyl cis-trans isomerase